MPMHTHFYHPAYFLHFGFRLFSNGFLYLLNVVFCRNALWKRAKVQSQFLCVGIRKSLHWLHTRMLLSTVCFHFLLAIAILDAYLWFFFKVASSVYHCDFDPNIMENYWFLFFISPGFFCFDSEGFLLVVFQYWILALWINMGSCCLGQVDSEWMCVFCASQCLPLNDIFKTFKEKEKSHCC